jgi:S-adenosylmethionine-diacylgycerolhomoserine-N-methlytransferase
MEGTSVTTLSQWTASIGGVISKEPIPGDVAHRAASAGANLRTAWRMLQGMPRADSHAARLDAFYGPQAAHYDRFRERLLHGRAELIGSLRLPPDAHIIEFGAGTGNNLRYFGASARDFRRVELVDLCAPLLDIARSRYAGLPHVHAVHADATRYRPTQAADCVLFAYSLSMIPDWRAALVNALACLRPGGTLAVVDFHIAPPHPAPGFSRHDWLTRQFWPRWFAHDGVHLRPQLLPTLCAAVPLHEKVESRGPVPGLPGLSVPWFRFSGVRA